MKLLVSGADTAIGKTVVTCSLLRALHSSGVTAIAAGYTLYAVLGLVGSYLGIYFYLRVIQYTTAPFEPPNGPAHLDFYRHIQNHSFNSGPDQSIRDSP